MYIFHWYELVAPGHSEELYREDGDREGKRQDHTQGEVGGIRFTFQYDAKQAVNEKGGGLEGEA